MPQVIGETENLVTAIQQSEAYLSYDKVRKILLEDKELSERTDAFRKKVFLFQNGESQESDSRAIVKLQEEYKDILSNPKVLKFLACEKAFVDLMRSIYSRIGAAVAFDLSFLEDEKWKQ